MLETDLFVWWAISISWSIIFLITISIYLYTSSKKKEKKISGTTAKKVGFWKNFVFIWVLLGLLALYIVSINIGSAFLFAIGNIIVEAILLIYLVSNRKEKSE